VYSFILDVWVTNDSYLVFAKYFGSCYCYNFPLCVEAFFWKWQLFIATTDEYLEHFMDLFLLSHTLLIGNHVLLLLIGSWCD